MTAKPVLNKQQNIFCSVVNRINIIRLIMYPKKRGKTPHIPTTPNTIYHSVFLGEENIFLYFIKKL